MVVFGSRVLHVLADARQMAVSTEREECEPEHVLAVLCREDASRTVARLLLNQIGAVAALEPQLPHWRSASSGHERFARTTRRLKHVFVSAMVYAHHTYNEQFFYTAALLHGVVEVGDGAVADTLRRCLGRSGDLRRIELESQQSHPTVWQAEWYAPGSRVVEIPDEELIALRASFEINRGDVNR